MANELDISFLRLALKKAQEGQQTPGGAQVGAVLVENEETVYAAFNEGDLRHDPTAHAEMVAIRDLCALRKTAKLEGLTLYCTLQPCGMCTMACLWAGISRIVYGAGRGDVNSVYFESRHLNTSDFIRDAFRSDLKIEGGVLREQCSELYAKGRDELPANSTPAHGNSVPPR